MTGDEAGDDDLVPISVRLGEVVPPEDPEDWTRPLTWVVAVGMLLAPLAALAWFLVAAPTTADAPLPGTLLVASLLAVGAAVAGATQLSVARAWTTTLGAGLFAALVLVILGVVMAGERQVGAASPTLGHAFAAAVGGLAGAAVAALAAALVAGRIQRPLRALVAAVPGALVAAGAVTLVLSG